MQANIIINLGSSSKKYSVYDEAGTMCLSAHMENENGQFVVNYINNINNSSHSKLDLSIEDYRNSFSILLQHMRELNLLHIISIGMRVVAPGSYFQKSQRIDAVYIEELKKIRNFDPLHIEPMLSEIESILSLHEDIPVYAISDSEIYNNSLFKRNFHLDEQFAALHDIYRFGYHGISVGSIINTLKEGDIEYNKAIICHLGGGSSVTAVYNDIPVYNSMGYISSEGLMSSTRSGGIGLGGIIKLMYDGLKVGDIVNLSYQSGGLLAISHLSSDMRVLIENYDNNPNAKRAIGEYLDDIIMRIGQTYALMNGVDTIVLTGTIGIRSEFIRNHIFNRLRFLNLHISHNNNSDDIINTLSSIFSKIKVLVIRNDEEKEMYKKLRELNK